MKNFLIAVASMLIGASQCYAQRVSAVMTRGDQLDIQGKKGFTDEMSVGASFTVSGASITVGGALRAEGTFDFLNATDNTAFCLSSDETCDAVDVYFKMPDFIFRLEPTGTNANVTMDFDPPGAGRAIFQKNGTNHMRFLQGDEVELLVPVTVSGSSLTVKGNLKVLPSGTPSGASVSDEVIFDNNDTMEVSIISSNNRSGRLKLGTPDDSTGAHLEYSDSADNFAVGTTKAGDELQLISGNQVEAVRFYSDQTSKFAGAMSISGSSLTVGGAGSYSGALTVSGETQLSGYAGVGGARGSNFALDVKGETADATKSALRLRDSSDVSIFECKNDKTCIFSGDLTASQTTISGSSLTVGGLIESRGTASGASAAGAANIIIDDTGVSYLQWLGDTSGFQGLLFGDTGAVDRGQITYNHATDILGLGAGGATRMNIGSASSDMSIPFTLDSATLTVTGTGASTYSLALSSGLEVSAGGIVAPQNKLQIESNKIISILIDRDNNNNDGEFGVLNSANSTLFRVREDQGGQTEVLGGNASNHGLSVSSGVEVLAGTALLPGTTVSGDLSVRDALSVGGRNAASLTLSSGVVVNDGGVQFPGGEVRRVGYAGFTVYASSAMSPTSGTETEISYDTETWDPQNDYDTADHRYTPSNEGMYKCFAQIEFTESEGVGNATSIRMILEKNNSNAKTSSCQTGSANKWISCAVEAVVSMAVGDFIEFEILHDDAKSITINNAENSSFASCFWIGGL